MPSPLPSKPPPAASPADLREPLLTLDRRYGPQHLTSDPLQFPRRYTDREDREAVAFIAALLAFGNARAICRSVAALLDELGPRPSAALEGGVRLPPSLLRRPLHRWVRWNDMARFLAGLGRLRREAGGLEAAFIEGDPGGPDLGQALSSFVGRLRLHCGGRAGRGLRYLLVSPESGSACKRWNLLLRWLVRPDDGLDLGLWTSIRAGRLLVPLDTHMARIARAIGLTRRRTPDWRMAREITDALRDVDPSDPVRFDFAMTRLGILEHCPGHREPAGCAPCPLREVCAL